MSQAVFLVLALEGSPAEPQLAALSAYERRRHVTLTRAAASTAKTRAPEYAEYDERVVSDLEAELAAARMAAASLDETRALELLGQVEQRLRAHPELPQSAWLMAERLRLAADIASRFPPSGADLPAYLERAFSLEGERAAEFGAALPRVAGPALEQLVVEGLDARDRLEVDGLLATGRTLELRAGEHHVRVLRRGRLLYAAWVTLGRGARSLRLRVPAIEPCTRDDFAGFRIERGRAHAAPGTRCSRWVLAAPAAGGLDIADCFGARCGSFVSYRASPSAPLHAALPQPRRERASSSLVLNMALISAAVLATGAVALWQAGAFDGDAPQQTQWIYGGAQPSP